MNQTTAPSRERDSARGPGGGLVGAWGLLAAAAALAAWLVSTPFLSLHALSAAAGRHDDAALQRYADLPRIRASLAAQLNAAPADTATSRQWWSGIQHWFSQQAGNTLLMAVDTPQGLVALVSGYGRWSLVQGGRDRAQQIIGVAPRRLSLPEGTRWRLVSLSQARITVPDRSDPAQSIDLLLRREGLRWKLVDIRLPAVQIGSP